MQQKSILLIHGLSGSPKTLEPLQKRLEQKGFLTSCPLLPGHGGEPEELYGIRYEDWINTVQTELDKLKQKSSEIILFGHSMGGLIATVLASRNPEIKKLVLLSPGFIRIYPISRLLLKLSPFLQRFKRWYRLSAESKVPIETVREFRDLKDQASQKADTVNQDTLIFHGKKDRTVSYKNSERMKKRFKNAKLELIEDMGHTPRTQEQWDLLSNEISDFIVSNS